MIIQSPKSVPRFLLYVNPRRQDGRGQNLIGFKPSKSSGMRRFFPAVAKSNPWSFEAHQTSTASPSSRPPKNLIPNPLERARRIVAQSNPCALTARRPTLDAYQFHREKLVSKRPFWTNLTS
ncbi:hypothetical protein ACW9UM_18915 (plasmid) [Marinovum sp. KMM 9989]